MRIAERSFAAWAATFYAALGLTQLTGCGGTTSSSFMSCAGGSKAPGGYESCGGGVLHRPSKQVCPNNTPRPGVMVTADGGPNFCTKDSDCTAKPYGYCMQNGVGADGFTICSYGCTQDSECPAGDICLCDEPVGQCVQASCTQDSECTGGMCASYNPEPGCPSTSFACQTPRDTCLSDAECPNLQHCTLNADKVRVCMMVQCAVGRPFIVGGAALLAPLRKRDDFSSELSPEVGGLGDDQRVVAAAYWANIGLMEHASIAAFARFALELLSLGAPPSLLDAAHAAMADEMVHARDAFALASKYAARAVGPGPLDTSAALANRTPLDIVRTAIVEGCIGETVAAVAAGEALRQATDPAVRAALARVVPDETRHAELAWRFVQWVLRDGPPELRTATARELVAVVEAAMHDAGDIAERDGLASDVLREHGVLSPTENAEIRARVLSEIVLPCARALVASTQPRGAMPVASGDMPWR
jgi:hypothetical protein